ncbi:MAG: hypothetical protein KA523_00070 [Flavobacterium sp.]|nr:hypothetical protein [Flavobacterium sp.]
MKPINFFIEKSESFIEKLNSIELVEYQFGFATKDIYGESDSVNNSEYENQQSELSEIKFQIKLMLSEFDNGRLFSERLNSLKPNYSTSNEPLKNSLVKNTQLFLDFLNEYRV